MRNVGKSMLMKFLAEISYDFMSNCGKNIGFFWRIIIVVWVKYPPMAAVPNYPNNGPQRSRQSAGPGGA